MLAFVLCESGSRIFRDEVPVALVSTAVVTVAGAATGDMTN